MKYDRYSKDLTVITSLERISSMDAILDYIENTFSKLPKAKQITSVKDEITANMEDRYIDLITSGYSETAAEEKVISEYINIEDIFNDIDTAKQYSIYINNEYSHYYSNDHITVDEVNKYMKTKLLRSKFSALSFSLVMFGIIMLVVLTVTANMFGRFSNIVVGGAVVSFVIFVIIAAAVYIVSNNNIVPYDYIESDKDYVLNEEAHIILDSLYDNVVKKHHKYMFLGVLSCVLGAILLIYAGITQWFFHPALICMMILDTISVDLFIISRAPLEGYKRLYN